MSTAATSHHTTPNEHSEQTGVAGSPSFWMSKLGSLLAILPLGVWTVNHLWRNLTAFSGATAWEASVTGYSHPIAQVVTLVVVLLPLLLHTVWGVGRLFSMRPNNQRYGYFGNWKYLLQRLSAMGLFAFLCAHIYLAFIKPRIIEGHPEAFSDISAYMHHHTPTLIVYLLGTLAVSYHLGNGLWSFGMAWGLVASRPALKRFDYVSMLCVVVLLALSWSVIYAMYQAGAQFPPPADM